jgi:hypothetical protein
VQQPDIVTHLRALLADLLAERRWRVGELHSALAEEGIELSRASLYRVMAGQAEPSLELAFWAMRQRGLNITFPLQSAQYQALTPAFGQSQQQLVSQAELQALVQQAALEGARQAISRLFSQELFTPGMAPSAGPSASSVRERLSRSSGSILDSIEPAKGDGKLKRSTGTGGAR